VTSCLSTITSTRSNYVYLETVVGVLQHSTSSVT
jgi:hypothetical protein